MAFLTPAELLRIAPLRPELRDIVLPIMQAVEDATGHTITVPPNGGYRSNATQVELYANRASNPYPVAVPGKSRHEYGAAVDLDIIGGADSDYSQMATIASSQFGLASGYPGDRVHMQLDETLDQSIAAWNDLQASRGADVSTLLLVGLAVYVLTSGAVGKSRRR